MTAPAVLPHWDALLARLAISGVPIGQGVAPREAEPHGGITEYAVLYLGPATAVRESLADARTDAELSVQVTCVGVSPERCLWVADRITAALAQPLTVEGRQAWRLEGPDGPAVHRDDSVTPPLWLQPLQYTLRSTAA
ncbi:hypothetical protein [Streptomyces harbinensis]|uniref:hypothetical protein n=1 Tax=Streptomyces harbinensis TaxID=1176198 RepID=UPI0036D0926B